MRYLFAGGLVALSCVANAYCWRAEDFSTAGNWALVSNSSGTSTAIAQTEDALTNAEPWVSSGVRSEWEALHTTNMQRQNHVLAATLDGSSATQNAVFVESAPWSDTDNSASAHWIVTFNCQFLAVDQADIANLRATIQFKYGTTVELTLPLVGTGATGRVYNKFYTHTWSDTPETGAQWTMTVTLSRVATGGAAMIMMDNIHVTEDRTLEGTVSLGGFDGIPKGIPLAAQVMNGASVLETHYLTLDESGYFCSPLTSTGTHDFLGKCDRWLAVRKASIAISADRSTINWSFEINGDPTGDNSVDIKDFNAVIVAFGTIPGMDPVDLNGNGIVDIKDLNLTLINFGLVGDT